jgi:small subunit ribosomal protein S6
MSRPDLEWFVTISFCVDRVSMLHLLWQLRAFCPNVKRPDAYPKEGGGFVRRDYELGFILNPEVNEEQTSAILERIEKIVNNHDGQVVKVNQWGRRRLAYPIEHHRDGYYVFIDMILTPETVLELDRTLKVSEEVMRHMVTKRDPKAVQKEREEREEREARAAAAAAQAQETATAEPEVADETQVPVELVTEPAEETPVGEEEPIALSPEEIEYVPPAIEENIEA